MQNDQEIHIQIGSIEYGDEQEQFYSSKSGYTSANRDDQRQKNNRDPKQRQRYCARPNSSTTRNRFDQDGGSFERERIDYLYSVIQHARGCDDSDDDEEIARISAERATKKKNISKRPKVGANARLYPTFLDSRISKPVETKPILSPCNSARSGSSVIVYPKVGDSNTQKAHQNSVRRNPNSRSREISPGITPSQSIEWAPGQQNRPVTNQRSRQSRQQVSADVDNPANQTFSSNESDFADSDEPNARQKAAPKYRYIDKISAQLIDEPHFESDFADSSSKPHPTKPRREDDDVIVFDNSSNDASDDQPNYAAPEHRHRRSNQSRLDVDAAQDKKRSKAKKSKSKKDQKPKTETMLESMTRALGVDEYSYEYEEEDVVETIVETTPDGQTTEPQEVKTRKKVRRRKPKLVPEHAYVSDGYEEEEILEAKTGTPVRTRVKRFKQITREEAVRSIQPDHEYVSDGYEENEQKEPETGATVPVRVKKYRKITKASVVVAPEPEYVYISDGFEDDGKAGSGDKTRPQTKKYRKVLKEKVAPPVQTRDFEFISDGYEEDEHFDAQEPGAPVRTKVKKYRKVTKPKVAPPIEHEYISDGYEEEVFEHNENEPDAPVRKKVKKYRKILKAKSTPVQPKEPEHEYISDGYEEEVVQNNDNEQDPGVPVRTKVKKYRKVLKAKAVTPVQPKEPEHEYVSDGYEEEVSQHNENEQEPTRVKVKKYRKVVKPKTSAPTKTIDDIAALLISAGEPPAVEIESEDSEPIENDEPSGDDKPAVNTRVRIKKTRRIKKEKKAPPPEPEPPIEPAPIEEPVVMVEVPIERAVVQEQPQIEEVIPSEDEEEISSDPDQPNAGPSRRKVKKTRRIKKDKPPAPVENEPEPPPTPEPVVEEPPQPEESEPEEPLEEEDADERRRVKIKKTRRIKKDQPEPAPVVTREIIPEHAPAAEIPTPEPVPEPTPSLPTRAFPLCQSPPEDMIEQLKGRQLFDQVHLTPSQLEEHHVTSTVQLEQSSTEATTVVEPKPQLALSPLEELIDNPEEEPVLPEPLPLENLVAALVSPPLQPSSVQSTSITDSVLLVQSTAESTDIEALPTPRGIVVERTLPPIQPPPVKLTSSDPTSTSIAVESTRKPKLAQSVPAYVSAEPQKKQLKPDAGHHFEKTEPHVSLAQSDCTSNSIEQNVVLRPTITASHEVDELITLRQSDVVVDIDIEKPPVILKSEQLGGQDIFQELPQLHPSEAPTIFESVEKPPVLKPSSTTDPISDCGIQLSELEPKEVIVERSIPTELPKVSLEPSAAKSIAAFSEIELAESPSKGAQCFLPPARLKRSKRNTFEKPEPAVNLSPMQGEVFEVHSNPVPLHQSELDDPIAFGEQTFKRILPPLAIDPRALKYKSLNVKMKRRPRSARAFLLSGQNVEDLEYDDDESEDTEWEMPAFLPPVVRERPQRPKRPKKAPKKVKVAFQAAPIPDIDVPWEKPVDTLVMPTDMLRRRFLLAPSTNPSGDPETIPRLELNIYDENELMLNQQDAAQEEDEDEVPTAAFQDLLALAHLNVIMKKTASHNTSQTSRVDPSRFTRGEHQTDVSVRWLG